MNQHITGPHETETAGRNVVDRAIELAGQHWNRGKSLALARNEGIEFDDEHWAVIIFMRKYYLEHGLPISARTTARALSSNFSSQGGNKYLHRLFNDGPVTQSSRLANLRIPAFATDASFGTSY